jgi:hypothetical protein
LGWESQICDSGGPGSMRNNLDTHLGFLTLSDVPTVLTIRNIRVMIYSNDHPPPHTHAVRRGGALAKFELNCPNGPVVLAEQAGFRTTEIAEIGAAIAAELPAVCLKWRAIHG